MWRAESGTRAQRPVEFKRIHETIKFMDFLKKTLKMGEAHLWISVKGRYSGTYAHWQIALAYAKYLSPEFHAWANKVLKERFEEEADPYPGKS